MTRFALLPCPLAGHVYPALALACALARDGHEVDVHVPDRWRPEVAAAGAALRPFEASPPPPGAPADPALRAALIPFEETRAALAVLPQVLPQLEHDPPDVVVYDALSVAGRLAAEIHEGRRAMFCTTWATNERFAWFDAGAGAAAPELDAALDGFISHMLELAALHGSPRLGLRDLLLHHEPLTLVLVPEALQPERASFGPAYRFVGPLLREADAAPLDPGLAGLGGRPLVYVSLGTLFNVWPAFYERCFAAFGGGPWDVVVAGLDGREHPAPAPVRVRRFVPQLALLQRAAAFVTHGGLNSAMEALHAGVPMVVVPQIPEQRVTAAVLAEQGAALVLERSDVTATALHAAVARVVGDPAFGRAARDLGRRCRSGGAAAAARELAALAQSTAASASSTAATTDSSCSRR